MAAGGDILGAGRPARKLVRDGGLDIAALCRAIMERSSLPIALTEGEAHVLRCATPAFHRLVAGDRALQFDQPLDRSWLGPGEDGQLALLDRVYRTGEAGALVDLERADPARGRVYWACIVWPLLDGQGHSAGLVLQGNDITVQVRTRARDQQVMVETRKINEQLLIAAIRAQEQAEESGRLADALRRQALYDNLTALPNRALFHDRLRQAILTAHREDATLAILFLDLDRFKAVNDNFGHHAGDLVLQEVGERLRDALRAPDTVARFGGDEFAVLLPTPIDLPGARLAARKLLRALAQPFLVHGQPHRLGASVGVALYPQHGTEVDLLIRGADAAMYVAKRAGGGYAVSGPDEERHDFDSPPTEAVRRDDGREAALSPPVGQVAGPAAAGYCRRDTLPQL